MAGGMAEVLLHEADVPDENFGDQFDAPGFMTLEQAERSLDRTVFQQVRQSVWPNVVQVIVPVDKGENAYGTGFIFKGPGDKKLVMTNYHVIRDFNQSLKRPITVKLDYDMPNTGRIIQVADCQIKYYSHDGRVVDADHRDFCALTLEEDPERDGIILEVTRSHLEAMFSKSMWNATNSMLDEGQRYGKGLIVGHPRGSYKRISIVTLTPCESVELFIRNYEERGTRPGSSGSPVVCNCANLATSAEWVCVLHFASGQGVTIVKVLEAINQQMKTLMSHSLHFVRH